MSYRRKKLLALFCATALSMTAVAGCTGTKSSTGNLGNRNKCRRNISTE